MKGIEIAKKYIGLQEVRDGAKIETFLKAESHGGDLNINPAKISWCAAFVNACEREVGNEGTGKLNARSFLDYGKDVSDEDPGQEGDIIVFDFEHDGIHGHVSYFVRYNDDQNSVTCLGGNQDNQVRYSDYSQDNIIGIRRN